MTPEKMQETNKMLEKLSKDLKYLDAKLHQYRANMEAAKNGKTPELKAYYESQKEQFVRYLDVYDSKLNLFKQMANEAQEEMEAHTTTKVEAILRKMLIASEKDPSLREEADEWVESYKKVFGKKDVFGI